MPIYEYRCRECGKTFERLQKVTDDGPGSCPFCSGEVVKLISNCSFQLKGTGWYVTDYARKSEENTTKDQKETEKKEKKASATKEKKEEEGSSKKAAGASG
jgi:putative FmdB family regulatory protein